MRLWSAYKKFLDRRAMRYGEDEWLKDALRDAERANLFDFSGSTSSLVEGLTAATGLVQNPGMQKTPRVFELDTFFLPFERCAAEFSVPGADKLDVGADQVGALGGRILGLVGRPEGHTIGFGTDIDWPVMIVSHPVELPNSFRILKVVLSGKRVAASYRPYKTMPFGKSETRFNCFLYSCCDYEINTGKCTYSWNYTEGQDSIFSKELAEVQNAKQEREMLRTAASHYACWTLAMLDTANSPANWVVRVTDEHARVVKRRGKKATDRRSRLIVVPDRELDKVIRRSSDASDFIEKSPHRRRAHYRRLNSEFYRLKRGQRILVKESWVGPKEATHDGCHYRVLTSLPSADEVKV